MKTKLLTLFLLAGSSVFAGTRIFLGFGGGYYPPAPVVAYVPPPPPPSVAYLPPSPGPAYSWVAGYWAPAGPRWTWRAGYWAPRPYAGAVWIGPRYYGHRYYPGYWRR